VAVAGFPRHLPPLAAVLAEQQSTPTAAGRSCRPPARRGQRGAVMIPVSGSTTTWALIAGLAPRPGLVGRGGPRGQRWKITRRARPAARSANRHRCHQNPRRLDVLAAISASTPPHPAHFVSSSSSGRCPSSRCASLTSASTSSSRAAVVHASALTRLGVVMGCSVLDDHFGGAGTSRPTPADRGDH